MKHTQGEQKVRNVSVCVAVCPPFVEMFKAVEEYTKMFPYTDGTWYIVMCLYRYRIRYRYSLESWFLEESRIELFELNFRVIYMRS